MMDFFDLNKKNISFLYASTGTITGHLCYMLFPIYSSLLTATISSADVTLAPYMFWAIFSSGYLIRPLGAYLFGKMKSQRAMQDSLFLSPLIIGIATFCIGILPGYDSIGYFSVFLLFLLRMLQGISAAGDFPLTAIFMLHNSPENEKNIMSGRLAFMSSAGTMLATICSTLFIREWRAVFIIAGTFSIISAVLRTSLEKHVDFVDIGSQNQIDILSMGKKLDVSIVLHILFLNLAVSAYAHTGNFWWKDHMIENGFLSISQAAMFITVGRVALTTFKTTAGNMAEKYGTVPSIKIGLIGCIIAMPLIFYSSYQGFFYIAQILYAAPLAMLASISFKYCNDILKTKNLGAFEIALMWHIVQAFISPIVSLLPQYLAEDFLEGNILYVIAYIEILMCAAFIFVDKKLSQVS